MRRTTGIGTMSGSARLDHGQARNLLCGKGRVTRRRWHSSRKRAAGSAAGAREVAVDRGPADPQDGGGDRLLEAAEPDATLGRPGDRVDQMPEGAAEAVELPHDQGVAGAELVQDLGKGGAGWPVRAPLAVSTNTR